MDVTTTWRYLLSRFSYGLIEYICWFWWDWCILVDDYFGIFGKLSEWMAIVGEFENGENDYMSQMMDKWTSCWLEKSLVVNGCHERQIFKVQVFIVNRQ